MKKTKLQHVSLALTFTAIILIFTGCGSSKQVATTPAPVDNEVILYCSGAQYMSDSEFMRANSSGASGDMEIARDKALTNARARLAAQLKVFTSGLTDFYKKDTRLGENAGLQTRFENIISEAFDNALQGTYPICEKVIKEDNGYRAYVAIEMGGSKFIEQTANRISADDELKVDYDYEKFKKSYKDAMEELRKKGN